MDTNNLFSDFQHGFWDNQSCDSQLFREVHQPTIFLDIQPVEMVVLDFRMAFDKVPHQCLATIPEYYGIRGHTK